MKYFLQNHIKIRFFAFLFFFPMIYSCSNEIDQKQNESISPKEKIQPKTPKAEYTEKEAGEWESLKEDHLPVIKINENSKTENIEVKVLGEFTEQHYIERIGIMDENKQDLAGLTLKKLQKPTIILTLYPVPKNPKIKVYAKCNLHDLWTIPIIPTEENSSGKSIQN